METAQHSRATLIAWVLSLADEMGLGKTVECIATMLKNNFKIVDNAQDAGILKARLEHV